jgi:hypothetical protein
LFFSAAAVFERLSVLLLLLLDWHSPWPLLLLLDTIRHYCARGKRKSEAAASKLKIQSSSFPSLITHVSLIRKLSVPRLRHTFLPPKEYEKVFDLRLPQIYDC